MEMVSAVEAEDVLEAPVKEKVDHSAEEVEKNITQEQQEARERFKNLIELVSARYESLPKKVREDFVAHNNDILNNAVELGMKMEMKPEELKALEVAAILHDLSKADAVPGEFKNVPNYTLVMHGELAAEESKKILTDEKLKGFGFEGDLEATRTMIAEAIREHMGPHPGFMTAMLEKANAALKTDGKKEIVHDKARGKVAETLLAVDMESLASARGRKKVMSLRQSGEFFQGQDQKTVEQYKAMGVDLSMGEAALLSGFDSAFQARDMIDNSELKAWIIKAIDESLNEAYAYGEEKIDPRVALVKRDNFESLRAEKKVEQAVADEMEKWRQKIASL